MIRAKSDALTMDLRQRLQAGVAQGVDGGRGRVWVRTDSGSAIDDVLAQDIVRHCSRGLFEPAKNNSADQDFSAHTELTMSNVLGHGIRPSLAHAPSLCGLKTASSASARHPICDTVGHLMRDNIVLEGAIALGLCFAQVLDSASSIF